MEDKIHRSKISNFEWGIVIAILAIVDILQFVLIPLLVGLVANEAVDVAVGFFFGLYLHLRGEKLSDPKRIGAFLATFGLEFIPVVDGLPFWCLDGIYNYVLARNRNRHADAQAARQKQEEKQTKKLKAEEQNARKQQARQDPRYQSQSQDQNMVEDDDEDEYQEAA